MKDSIETCKFDNWGRLSFLNSEFNKKDSMKNINYEILSPNT